MLALRLDLDVDVAGVDEGGLGEAGDHAGIVRGSAVRIDGTDKGEGIGGIYLPRLTGRFCRVVSHRSREQGGRAATGHRDAYRDPAPGALPDRDRSGTGQHLQRDPACGVTAGGQLARSSANQTLSHHSSRHSRVRSARWVS